MVLKDLEGLRLYKEYQTKILKDIRVDDITNLFDNDRVVYITANLFTPELLEKREVTFRGNTAEAKKRRIADSVPNLYKLVSIDYSVKYRDVFSTSFEENGIFHLPILRINKFIDRLYQIFSLLFFLLRERKNYDSILFYNFLHHTSLAPLCMHFIFGKKLVVDFEDNYDKHYLSVIRKWVSRYIDGAILVNENQEELIKNRDARISVINTFADLDYVKPKLNKKVNDLKVIYSGKIDRLRGADLIPEFSNRLEQQNIRHKIIITGYGDFNNIIGSNPLMKKVEKNIEFLGFVSPSRLNHLLESSDLALAFDKPDLDQNRYLYPSKVQLYAEHRLPILILE